jgi:hypothetical protein
MRALLALLLLCTSLRAQERTVDHRYAPEGAFAAICFPEDWQKTVVTDRGELGYDFGPGPYARPLTKVGIGLMGDSLRVARQYFDDPRIPVATTEFEGAQGLVLTRAFALVRERETPERPSSTAHLVRRLGGLTGTFDWASPPPGTDSAFRNVAWGVNRPIRYRVSVPPGSSWNVALGLCEPYKPREGMRILELHVEGAPPLTVDPLHEVERGHALVRFLSARDANGDGALELEAHASIESPDPNVTLSAFWLFPPATAVTEEAIISGEASRLATIAYDCGPEERFYVSAPRIDGLAASFPGPSVTPLVVITTRRRLEFDPQTGIIAYHGEPHLVTHPSALAMVATESGYVLELPTGTRELEVAVLHGPDTEGGIRSLEPFDQELLKARWYWQHSPSVPRATISIPDSALQYVLEANIRNLYQIREVVDSVAQFQPGPSVYRGLWVHDAVWHDDAALVLGDTAAVRENLEGILSTQQDDGRIRVMDPYPMNKETGTFLFSAVQYALSSGDTVWLRRVWPRLMHAVAWIQEARLATLRGPATPFAGLLPPSFADGGLSGVNAEYGGVYASLIGLAAMARGAQKLGQGDDRQAVERLFHELYGSFREAARRDARRDSFGNLYLPMMVGDTSSSRPPQQAQWGLCEAVFLGRFLHRDDSLVTGTLAMLESAKEQGLPLNTGWLQNGIWPFIAGFVGMAHLWQGDYEAATDLLYAYANHSSPLGTWVEEQLPQRLGTRTTGDGSNASASSLYISLVRRLLLQERGDTLEILAGIPHEWIRPGSGITVRNVLSECGPVSFSLHCTPGGEALTLHIDPAGNPGMAGGILVSFRALKEAGFRLVGGVPTPDSFRAGRGRELTLTFTH